MPSSIGGTPVGVASSGRAVFAPIPSPASEILRVDSPAAAEVDSQVIVIHPGSMYLRIGRASDAFPVTLPHCIARRHMHAGAQTRYEDGWMIRLETEHEGRATQQTEGLECATEALASRPTDAGVLRRPTRPEQVCRHLCNQLSGFNRMSKPEVTDVISNVHWSDVRHAPQFLIGQEALMVNPDDPYDLHWPIRRGQFNLHDGVGGSISAVIQDLHDIWTNALSRHLDIRLNEIANYHVVLLIPDIYRRRDVRELTELLLTKMGFSALFLVQESVCATFGAGVTSACVVDAGDQTVSVCCVEDGLSHRSTRLCMAVGGSDASRCLYWMLTRAQFPYRQCSLERRLDALLIQDLKETYCHLEQEVQDAEDHTVLVRWPTRRVVRYAVRLGDERILAPLSLFFPDMLGLQGGELWVRGDWGEASDPSDPLDDDYLLQTMSKHEKSARQRRRGEGAGGSNAPPSQDNSLGDYAPQGDDDDTMDQNETLGGGSGGGRNNGGARLDDDMDLEDAGGSQAGGGGGLAGGGQGLVGIHEAIVRSIEKCESEEMKRRMYSCVVVVGGGLAQFPGAQSWLQYLLWAAMSQQARLALDYMDIITRAKELDPRVTCWKGAAILSALDSARELWVTRDEWTKYGVRVLRERAAFLW